LWGAESQTTEGVAGEISSRNGEPVHAKASTLNAGRRNLLQHRRELRHRKMEEEESIRSDAAGEFAYVESPPRFG